MEKDEKHNKVFSANFLSKEKKSKNKSGKSEKHVFNIWLWILLHKWWKIIDNEKTVCEPNG